MRPLTAHCPKPLLEARGATLIEHHLRALAGAGIREVVINVSYLADLIRERLGDGARYGLCIQYSDEGDAPLETGGGMKRALPLLGPEPFLVVNGDVYLELDFASFCARACPGLAHLLLVPNPEFHPDGDFVLLSGGTGQARLRACGAPRMTYAGIGLFRPELVSSAEQTTFKLAPILREAMTFGQVTGERFDGFWSDVGTPERLEQLRRF